MGPGALIVDTGPLYVALDSSDADHAACVALFEEHAGTLIVPQLVVAEVAYFLARRLPTEAEVSFLGDIAAGTYSPEPVAPSDWLRIAELVWEYQDLPLGTTDASIVAAAERLGITTVATLDRRDFEAVRPAHVERFTLVP